MDSMPTRAKRTNISCKKENTGREQATPCGPVVHKLEEQDSAGLQGSSLQPHQVSSFLYKFYKVLRLRSQPTRPAPIPPNRMAPGAGTWPFGSDSGSGIGLAAMTVSSE